MTRRKTLGMRLTPHVVSLGMLLLCACAPEVKPHAKAVGLTVVQVDAQTPAPLQLAVQACVGLHNAKIGGSAYAQFEAHDAQWLDEVQLKPDVTVNAADFVKACVATFPSCVRYDYANQHALLPNILTVAAALGAVPLDNAMTFACKTTAFDAVAQFKDKATPVAATQYVFDHFGKQTTGLAMLNPGYDAKSSDLMHPPLSKDMRPWLVDFVFSHKLFVVFLVNGCIDEEPDKALLSHIVNAGHWPTPLGVYGYNSSWNVGGFLYEAQTLCLDSRNMGAIASEVNNLSFFASRAGPIVKAGEVTQNPLEPITYDAQKTYVAFVVGDGDNVQYLMTTRKDWFAQRISTCKQAGDACPPLTWTISPHLSRLAPDVLRWYYDQSHKTGKDYFTLPPSGHLYAYPSSLAEQDQDRFVTATEDDARILGVAGAVHWDWNGTWHDAEGHFLPKYASAAGPIRGIFPVNVPYMNAMFDWWPQDRFYEVLTGKDGGKLALFRPREWRGVNDSDKMFYLSPENLAKELGDDARGTVTWVYMTSDGGLSLENSFLAIAKLLPPHVQLVSADTATKLALAAQQK